MDKPRNIRAADFGSERNISAFLAHHNRHLVGPNEKVGKLLPMQRPKLTSSHPYAKSYPNHRFASSSLAYRVRIMHKKVEDERTYLISAQATKIYTAITSVRKRLSLSHTRRWTSLLFTQYFQRKRAIVCRHRWMNTEYPRASSTWRIQDSQPQRRTLWTVKLWILSLRQNRRSCGHQRGWRFKKALSIPDVISSPTLPPTVIRLQFLKVPGLNNYHNLGVQA